MKTHTSPQSNVVSFSALVIALIALVLSWASYERSKLDSGDRPQQQYEQTLSQLNVRMARIQAESRLAALQARQSVEQNYEAFQRDLLAIRGDLADAYKKAKLETSQEWIELNQEFDMLQTKVKNRTADSLQSLEAFIARLRDKIDA